MENLIFKTLTLAVTAPTGIEGAKYLISDILLTTLGGVVAIGLVQILK